MTFFDKILCMIISVLTASGLAFLLTPLVRWIPRWAFLCIPYVCAGVAAAVNVYLMNGMEG